MGIRSASVVMFLALLSGCGSSTAELALDSPAEITSPTLPRESPALVSSPETPKPPPGPAIGEFVQPKDVIVMVDRDETTDNDILSKSADALIDDYDTGSFTRFGPSNCGTVGACWKEASIGYNSHMWWTWNNAVTESNYGIWAPYLQCPGNYTVSAYIPYNNATTTQARYKVNHAYGTTQQNINQYSYSNAWAQLGGSYTFNKGSGGSVKLADATGATKATQKIGFDAIKWTWQSATSSLQVTYPNGGETWYKSGCLPVSWNSSGLSDNVRIHLYRYGSIVKGLNNNTANDGYECISASSFSDVTSGGGYTIGMSNVNSYCDGTVSDFSNSSFNIYSPSVTVNSPNGGESYMGTGTMGITWSSAGLGGNIRIQLCQYGSCNITIHDSASNNGSYNWSILNISGSGYKIRLTSVNDGSIWDESNGTFTITAPPSPVTTITTNGGNNFSTTQSSIQLTGTCTDGNNDLDWIRYTNSATGLNMIDYGPSGGSISFFPTIDLATGANPIQVTCQDVQGAWSTDSITITYSPVGAISGTVTNASGSALSNAIVTATGSTMTATASTNSSGQYSMGGLPLGTYSVTANMANHIDQTKSASVTAGGNATVNFALNKIPAAILSYSPTSNSVTMNTGQIDSTQTFLIQNNGDTGLNYSLSSNAPWLGVRQNSANALGTSFSLAPGAQKTFQVVYNSAGVSSSSTGTISISSNGGSGSINASMTINAPPPPPPAPTPQTTPTTTTIVASLYGMCPAENACYADPVNTALGNYLLNHTDLAIDSRGPNLVFARAYNSMDATVGPIGRGWTHSFNIYLLVNGNGDVYVRWGDGHTDWYVYNSSNNSFTPPSGIFSTLTKGGSYVLTDKAQNTFQFSLAGRLDSITDAHNNKLLFTYDDTLNRLTSVTNAVGNKLTLAYADGTYLSSVTDHAGRQVKFAYSGDLLTQVTDAKGKNYGFNYDANKYLTQLIERDGIAIVTNTYDASGRVVTQKDALGNLTQFQYNTPSAGQTTVTDPANRVHIYSYDSYYRLLSHKGPSGETVSYVYNALSLPTQITDANGKISSLSYDARGNMLSTTDALGAQTTWTYDALDRPITMTNPLGQITNYTYNTAGDLSQISTTLNGTEMATQMTYLATGEIATLTDPMGNQSSYTYDAPTGNLTSVTNFNGEKTDLVYDDLHRITSLSDALGHASTYAYDAHDNLITTTTPLSQTTSSVYNARDLRSSVTDPSGTTTYSYDNAGRLTGITDPSGTRTIGYNTINQRTSVTDPAGTTTYAYDPLGYLKTITDPTGRSNTMAHNAMGHTTSITDPAGKSSTFTLDAQGKPTQVTTPLSTTIKTAYNALGQPTQMTDPANNNFQTTYDKLGRLTQTLNPLSGSTTQQFDKNSRLTQVKTPNGNSYTWTYDKVGRVTSHTSPSGSKRTFVYDAAGRLTSVKNASNQTTSLAYDNGDRLTQVTFSDTTTHSITYDAADRPTQIADSGKTRSYTYDSAGRISSSTDYWGKTISYTYSTAGYLSSVTYPGNKTVAYSYDAAGRMTQVQDWVGITAYAYDSAGRLSQTSYPNGAKTTRSYDDGSRTTLLKHQKSDGTVIFSQSIAYDSRGNITSIDVTPEPTAWVPSATENYSSNNEDQYTQVGSDLLGYDPVGQMISRSASGSDYAFDARERLASVTAGGTTTSFTYGPEGERVQKSNGTTTHKYVVDTNATLPRVVAELDANNAPSTYYIYGLGLLAQIPASGGAVRYYHPDIQQNIAALTDSTGAVTDTYTYHPFGKVMAKTGTTNNPYQFAGALGVEQDATGLLYMRARYYDPTLGRFVSKDPLGLAAGLNHYDYTGANPLKFTDPSGEILPLLAMGLVWAADVAIASTAAFLVAPHVYTYMMTETAESVDNYAKDPSLGNAAMMSLDIAGMMPIGGATKAVSKVGKGLSNGTKGKMAEELISDSIGVERNVGKGREIIKGTGKGGFRVLDYPSAATIAKRGTVVESKNVMNLSRTNQIRDFQAFAKEKGVPLEIFIRPNTKLSQTLLDQVGTGPGQIIFKNIPESLAADTLPFILGPVGSAVESIQSIMPSNNSYFNLSGPQCSASGGMCSAK